MVVSVIRYLGNVPVAREEDEELAWSAVVEASAALVVVVVDDIRAILAVGLAGIVVDDTKTLCAFHHILEVDVMVMALAASLFERLVLAVLHAHRQVAAWNLVLALGDGEKVGLGDEVEECLPLLWVLLILQVEIYEVDTAVCISLVETIAPFSLGIPILGSFDEFWLVAIILGVIALGRVVGFAGMIAFG